MNKAEVQFLMKQGFTVSEIMEMEKPIETISTEGEKDNVVTSEVKAETPTEQVKEEPEKKTSSSDYSELLNQVKILNDTVKEIQDSNRQAVTITAPKEYTAEQAIQDFFNNEVNDNE